METYYLEDEKYYYKNGKWFTSSMIVAPMGLVSRLNKLLVKDVDFSSKSMEELLTIIDGARSADNNTLAAQVLETAIRISSSDELQKLLPRLTSNYRKTGKSQTAIDMAESYINKYGKQVESNALYTSLAAAYCDIENFEIARKLANKARALSAGESSPELISVYVRIKKMKRVKNLYRNIHITINKL